MSKVVRIIAGAVLTVAGVLTGNFQLILAGVSLVGGALLQPSASKNRAAASAQLQLGEQPRQGVLGRAAVGGSLVDAFNFGGKYGTDWEVLVIALADHRCDALEGFFVDDTYVAFAGDGIVPGFNNQLQVFWRDGRWDQEVPSILTTNGPGWTADDRGRGVAWVAVAYKADASDAKNPVFPSGRPRFRWVVRGLRCYQARKDSTVGGSGAHRRDNPATWEWTENPIDIRYNWVRGIYAGDRVTEPGMLLIGRGLTATEAPPANVFPRANLCDEIVDGQPRYRIGGIVASTEAFIDVEADFAAAVAGVISQPEGAVEVDPGQAKAPVAHFTDGDLLVGTKVRWSEFLGQQDDGWVNTVVARFVDPAQRWNIRSAPVRRETADVIADGGPREAQPQLDMVTNQPQAQRVAEIIRRLGRLWGRAQVTLPPRFAFIEEGDWVTWQSARRFGGATRTFRVEAWGSNKAWHHQLTLRQISASVYSDTAPLDDGVVASTQAPPPVVAPPAPSAWSAVAVTLDGPGLSVPALRITGAVDDPAARFVVFEYVQQIDPPGVSTSWTFAASSGPDVTQFDIPLASGGRFFVAVSYDVDGVLGGRRVLGPVDIGVISYPDGTPVDQLQPAEPGATEGALVPQPGSGIVGNIRDHLGQIYDPGELLNTALELTPDGWLQYRRQPHIPPITLGRLALPDLGAVSTAQLRRAEEDIDQVARALSVALDEASRTRQTFTGAGFFEDPLTGQIRIHAIEQTAERISTAEVRLNAAEASINLRATVNYVDEAILNAVIDPGQIVELDAVFLRLTAAEVDIDGLNATVTTLATATELSLVAGRVTTAEQAIDALEGQITTKVETTAFDALATRVTSAESTLTAIGDVAQITNAVTATRLLARDVDANAESDLRALLQGDRAQRDQVAAIASARQELRADVSDGLAAEAAARLALQVRVGVAEATAAQETIARISGDNVLAAQITALSASTTNSLGALNAALTTEQQARTSADTAIAASVTNLTASVTTGLASLNADLAAEEQARIAAINAEAASRVAAINAEAAARGTALTAEQQARIAAINAEAAARTAAINAEADARAQAVVTLNASITAADQARVSGDQALAGQINTLSASLSSEVADLEAAITNEGQARVAADGALATSITSLNASFSAAITAEQNTRAAMIAEEANNRGAAILAERDARIAAINAEASARGTALTAEEQARIAAINAEATARTNAIAAETSARQQAVTSLTASIQQEATARANADGALAGQITTLSTEVDGNTATLVTFGESIDGLRSRWGARTDVNGRITGIVLNNNGAQGDFTVVSDTFSVVDPDTGEAFIDADEGGLRLRNGRVIMDNGTFLKAVGVGFGTTGQFIEWFGPRPANGNLALCNEANALAYLKTNGDAYFGGTLSAGVIRNAARTTDIGAGANVTVGPFGTNGNPIQVITSYQAQSTEFATYAADQAGVDDWNAAVTAWGATPGISVSATKSISCTLTVRVDRAVGNGAPAQWATLTITSGTETLTGSRPVVGDQTGSLTYTRTVSGSITSTDNAGGTQNRTFTATITNRTNAVLGTINSQIVAVTATEE